MWNKYFLILLAGMLSFSLSAQSSRYGRRYRNRRATETQNVSPQPQKKTSDQAAVKNTSKTSKTNSRRKTRDLSPKFDPSKPGLSEAIVKKLLEEKIRKNLLEKEVASTIKETTKENFFSRAECNSILWQYRNLLNNFELVEVTKIKLEWYKRYGEELQKFKKIADDMYFALRRHSDEDFANAVENFRKQQQVCLGFLKGKQPKLSNEAYQSLIQKNSKIRQQNYLKRQREEREAAAKRRKEMLKRQEEKQKRQKYLKEHPEYLKEHPEVFLEYPELKKLFPEQQKNQTQNKDQKPEQDTESKKK